MHKKSQVFDIFENKSSTLDQKLELNKITNKTKKRVSMLIIMKLFSDVSLRTHYYQVSWIWTIDRIDYATIVMELTLSISKYDDDLVKYLAWMSLQHTNVVSTWMSFSTCNMMSQYNSLSMNEMLFWDTSVILST